MGVKRVMGIHACGLRIHMMGSQEKMIRKVPAARGSPMKWQSDTLGAFYWPSAGVGDGGLEVKAYDARDYM